jgi:hypothetical protein
MHPCKHSRSVPVALVAAHDDVHVPCPVLVCLLYPRVQGLKGRSVANVKYWTCIRARQRCALCRAGSWMPRRQVRAREGGGCGMVSRIEQREKCTEHRALGVAIELVAHFKVLSSARQIPKVGFYLVVVDHD